jgi:hypothetical protein
VEGKTDRQGLLAPLYVSVVGSVVWDECGTVIEELRDYADV